MYGGMEKNWKPLKQRMKEWSRGSMNWILGDDCSDPFLHCGLRFRVWGIPYRASLGKAHSYVEYPLETSLAVRTGFRILGNLTH